MKRNHIQIKNCKVSYIEKNEKAWQIIFFIHGNSGSAETWTNQLQDSKLSQYRLIAFDLPGHGSSDEPRDKEKGYGLCELGKTVAEAVKQLAGTASYILVGFSLGTNVLGEIMTREVKPKGIVLISPCILRTMDDLNTIFLPNPNAAYFFAPTITGVQLEALAKDCFYIKDATAKNNFKKDFLNTSTSFRPMLMKRASEGDYTNEIKTLTEYNILLLVVFGKEDKIGNADYLDSITLPLWKQLIYKLEKAGHFVHIDAAKPTTELIAAYATEVFKPSHASPHNA